MLISRGCLDAQTSTAGLSLSLYADSIILPPVQHTRQSENDRDTSQQVQIKSLGDAIDWLRRGLNCNAPNASPTLITVDAWSLRVRLPFRLLEMRPLTLEPKAT